MDGISRRSILTSGTAAALSAALPAGEAAAQAVVTRRSVGSMALADPILESYRKAVAAMKALPQADPRNWTRQAQIHQNFCPHRNWYFLPWHRAYILAFERLCRQLSGNPQFALPYWDWTADRQIPQAFAVAQWPGRPGQTNPLRDTTRTMPPNASLPTNIVGPNVIASRLAETNFELFGSSRPNGQNSTASTWQRAEGVEGPFESTPHDQVHVRVGGDMQTFMSPLDPIFWLHHCNMDRLWDRWNRMGRANSANSLWRNFAFNGQFVVPSGAGTVPFDRRVSQLLNPTTLGYRYVPLIVPFGTAAAEVAVAPAPIDLAKALASTVAAAAGTAKLDTVLAVSLPLDDARTKALARIQAPVSMTTAAAPPPAAGRIIAVIRDVEPPKSGNTEVRVFVNCPYLAPDTPPTDPHYAGAFTFFAPEHAEHGGDKRAYLIDLTDTVMTLKRAQRDIGNAIEVQLMPVAVPGQGTDVSFKAGRIEIAIM